MFLSPEVRLQVAMSTALTIPAPQRSCSARLGHSRQSSLVTTVLVQKEGC